MATGFRVINCPKRACSFCRGTRFELKCLPCSHNICTDCLLKRRLKNTTTKSVHCPLDENEFHLTNNGIDSLPTRGHLIEVSSSGHHFDQSPNTFAGANSMISENREIHELLTYTQEYRNDLADAIRDMEHCIEASLTIQEERVKEEIRATSESLVEGILVKEQELYQEVDRVIEAEKRDRQQEIADFALQAHHVIQVVEMNHGKFKQGTRDELLMKQVHTDLQAVKQRKSLLSEKQEDAVSDIFFIPNDHCFQETLGRVQCDKVTDQRSRRTSEDGPRSSSQGEPKRKPGQLLRIIIPPSPLSEKFRPWALSVSETGEIAVVDRGNNCIHIFTPRGEFLRHVAKPYGSKSYEVYGVTFVSRKTFAVAEYSPSTASGCVYEMSISGEHLRVIGNLKGPAHVTSFASGSSACKNIIAVYYMNGFEAPDVFVARDERKIELHRGENGLNHPLKGVFLKDKLVFSDINEVENQGCVKVFHSDGHYSHCFGQQPLWKGGSLGHPLRIAADPLNCGLLVYQQFTNRMRVYDLSGAFISEFPTASGLLDFAVTPEGRLIATCSRDSEFPNSVVILSYM